MEKINILANFLGCDPDDVDEIDDSYYSCGGNYYNVYDDYEVDCKIEDLLNQLLDQELDCFPKSLEHLKEYINRQDYIDAHMDFDIISDHYDEIVVTDEDGYKETYFIFEL